MTNCVEIASPREKARMVLDELSERMQRGETVHYSDYRDTMTGWGVHWMVAAALFTEFRFETDARDGGRIRFIQRTAPSLIA